ncbi:MAG: LLM class F420-dependent oxidoreductase [Chloroflexi bacterium]|nr:LLM class F420-dependent oxidoreductase [Chloroflexota bacterium]
MKLAINIGMSGAKLDVPVKKVLRAEELGYDQVWTMESWGSDAVTPLAYLAALTTRIKLGTGIMQIPARTPAMTAMTAATLDSLAGGNRVIAGLGVSGPQVAEGWYGQPWGKPYWKIRDYVTIMRKIFKREGPVTHQGREYQLPYTGEGAMGIGKPLQSMLHPNPDIPIWLACTSEATVRLTAEIADGWLPIHLTPRSFPIFKPWLEEGFRRAGNGKGYHNFALHGSVTVRITDDVESVLRRMKERLAFSVGGMGHRDVNFYNKAMANQGYEAEAARVMELWQAGHRDEAINAIPDEYVEDSTLLGSVERIKERYKVWADSPINNLTIATDQDEALVLMRDLARE